MRVILVVSNDLTIDQRLHKVCTSLLKNGYKPLLLGYNKSDSIALKERNYHTARLPMLFKKGKFFYLELNIRLFFYLLFSKVDIITANDLDTLLPCFLVSKIRSKVLVYDTHEYYTELPELQHRPFEKRIWTILEEFIFPKLTRISTVGKLIALEYEKKYKVPVKVVRNMPFRLEVSNANNRKEPILIYQGAVNLGRGLELMLETMTLLPAYTLWIIGEGQLLESIKIKSATLNNVKIFGRVPFEELRSLTSQAMIGLSLEEDLGLNYRYALPNKIFDYVHASIPIICSDLPEMRNLVEEYKLGEYLQQRSPHALAQLVNYIGDNEVKYQDYVISCQKAANILNWEAEEKILLSLYK